MDLDDEEAPSLVDVDDQLNSDDQKELKVPITIVTGKKIRLSLSPSTMLRTTSGYLGAGKTTLMNYILTEQHGKKIAVILNGESQGLSERRNITNVCCKNLVIVSWPTCIYRPESSYYQSAGY